ncbi:MAG: hypothetical protein JST12_01790 [Armatimonadetes bacterium]|nr:hypothetical protein [Armatimonadota bacterium]MBS1700368.1 hypothetical protein [Armatimonadota bacterium]
MKKRILYTALGTLGLSAAGFAQIPDLLNTIDAGSRSMGAGSAFGVTSADTQSILNNPAGIGFLSSKTFGIAYRNMPKSTTQIFGDIANPTYSSTGQSGKTQLAHFGYAFPLKKGGTFGFSYQVTGYLDDFRSGTNVTIGGFSGATYDEAVKAKTAMYTLAIGRTNGAGDKSFGWGLTIANLDLRDRQLGFVPGNPQTVLIDADNSASTWGVGLVAGFQSIPANRPNTTIGGSIRTPIKMSSNTFANGVYDVLPGQASFGMATRKDRLRGKDDYLILGGQASYYFGGSGTGLFDRNNQFVFGLGAEYNIVRDSATIPIRVGLSSIASGGSQFGDRNAFTFGFGYRPKAQPWSVDLNYGKPNGGGSDFAFAFNYRVEK